MEAGMAVPFDAAEGEARPCRTRGLGGMFRLRHCRPSTPLRLATRRTRCATVATPQQGRQAKRCRTDPLLHPPPRAVRAGFAGPEGAERRFAEPSASSPSSSPSETPLSSTLTVLRPRPAEPPATSRTEDAKRRRSAKSSWKAPLEVDPCRRNRESRARCTITHSCHESGKDAWSWRQGRDATQFCTRPAGRPFQPFDLYAPRISCATYTPEPKASPTDAPGFV